MTIPIQMSLPGFIATAPELSFIGNGVARFYGIAVVAVGVASRLRRRPQSAARVGLDLGNRARLRPANPADDLARRKPADATAEVVIESRDTDFVTSSSKTSLRAAKSRSAQAVARAS